jgi:hypothetical protein
MKPTTRTAMLILALIASRAVGADSNPTPLEIRPIEITSWAAHPDDLSVGLEAFLQGRNRRPGSQIVYLMTGKDLVGIKHDSLRIESVRTIDGAEISKKRNGEPAYQLLSLSTADSGKYCGFSVLVEGDHFGKVETLAIKGTIVALRSTKHEEKTIKLNLADRGQKTLGPFSVCLDDVVSAASDPIDDTGSWWESILSYLLGHPMICSFFEKADTPVPTRACGDLRPADTSAPKGDAGRIPFTFDFTIDEVTKHAHVPLKVAGPIVNLIAVKYEMDGQRRVASNTSWDGEGLESRTYNLPMPRHDAPLMVTVSYWTDVKESTVSFGK